MARRLGHFGGEPFRSPRSRVRAQVLVVIVLTVAIIVVVLGQAGKLGFREVDVSTNPFSGRALFADPSSAASVAAAEAAPGSEEARLFSQIAEQPTAVWLVPERHPIGTVGLRAAQIVGEAAAVGAMPLLVLYGIPNRDCGNFSSGGLAPSEYRMWVSEIAAAIDSSPVAVIVEPDSLALASECADVEDRVAQVREAARTLAQAGATVYLDGGHSNWLSASSMAQLLQRAGVDEVRGFATNVSNFNHVSDEMSYAAKVMEAGGGSHYVVDSSRGGNGSTGEWCNPPGRALGTPPSVVAGDDALDALLWIKPPGESDGPCSGGPAAGVWWPESAIELARNAGW